MRTIEKTTTADVLAFRVVISRGADEMMLTRTEAAMAIGISPATFSNAVTAGRLPKPYHIGGGIRGLPRWKLGDLRALLDRGRTSKSGDEDKGGNLSDAA